MSSTPTPRRPGAAPPRRSRRAVGDGQSHQAVLALRALVGHRRERLDRLLARVAVRRSAPPAARRRRAPSARPTCPRRSARPWSITAILSASRSASSRYWVVSRTVVPAATRASIVSHSPSRLTRVEAGGGLVEEDHGRASHQRGGQVEAAAHAAGVGPRRAGRRTRRGRTARAARSRACATRPCPGGRAGRPSRGSRSRSGSRRRPRTGRRGRSGSAASRRRAPRRGRRRSRCRRRAGSRVVRMRTAVVFPAPLGPSRPSTVPWGTRRSIPSSARTLP